MLAVATPRIEKIHLPEKGAGAESVEEHLAFLREAPDMDDAAADDVERGDRSPFFDDPLAWARFAERQEVAEGIEFLVIQVAQKDHCAERFMHHGHDGTKPARGSKDAGEETL